ncbi:redoxin domain-containing protein, partial [Caulobacter sp.]|uniref:redoxin domain-containing protein n=1 Tax=Caulobacter sp. TaxID=78 RepID=UPI003BB205F3
WGLVAAPAVGGALATCGAGLPDSHRALTGGGAWLNTSPLRAADLRGKVVLVNFWTYTCINSLRPLPYLRAWAERYRDRGLVIVGVHAPEFAFEHELPKVRQAVADLGVRYPVVLDNDFQIWRAFGNSAWPGFYFADAQGRVRDRRLGEGDYDQSERLIQALLRAAGGQTIADPIVPVAGEGTQAAPDWEDLGSPETYVGYAKAENFASIDGPRRDRPAVYQSPTRLPLNGWSLSGTWTVGSEFAALAGDAGAITFRFHARDLHLVMAPPADGQVVRFRVRLDGADPGADHGTDTDPQGWGELRQARLHQLVRQAGPVRDRLFEIAFQGPGARAYCFTFG